MIRVRYSPQLALPGWSIAYAWEGRILTVRMRIVEEDADSPVEKEVAETYNFSSLQPGDRVVGAESEVLPISPLVEAYVDDEGDLHVVLLHWYRHGENPGKPEEVLDG